MLAQPTHARFSPTSIATTSSSWSISSTNGVPLNVEIFTLSVARLASIAGTAYWDMLS
jgi:hypothetical protein